MICEPLERTTQVLGHYFIPGPSAEPLDDVIRKYDFREPMTYCKRLRCRLTEKACAALWVSGNQEWQPGNGRHLECQKCEQGRNLAKKAGMYSPPKRKPPRKIETRNIEIEKDSFQVDESRKCCIVRCKQYPIVGKNYCPAHFKSNEEEKKLHGECSVDGCDRAAFAKGLCRRHYAQRWRGQKLT